MFITLEGIEGSGKTEQIPHLSRYLNQRGISCQVTREPGGTAIGRQIRAILLDPQNDAIDPTTELLLYTADRVQHARTRILPWLQSGHTVICDRFFDATWVYQGMARGLDTQLIENLHRLVLNNLEPDVTFILDLPVETGLDRAWQALNQGRRDMRESRFETEAVSFHQRVRDGYLQLARKHPRRCCLIDASLPIPQVTHQLIQALASRHGIS